MWTCRIKSMRLHALSKVSASLDNMKQSVILDVANILLLHRAKVHLENHYKESAMMIACKKGYVELVRLMVPHDSWDDPEYVRLMFSVAVSNGHTKVVELLLTNEHVNIDSEMLVNQLHKACKMRDDPEMVRIILDKYPELVDCTYKDDRYGYTALMLASENGNTKVVKMLLNCGAQVDHQNKLQHRYGNEVGGLTALMVAVMSRKSETVELLLEEGADVDLTDSTGSTALIMTCENGQMDLAKLLIEKGANVNHVDCRGGNALLYAVKCAVSTRAKK